MFPLGSSRLFKNNAERLKYLILNFHNKGDSKLQERIAEESMSLIRLFFLNQKTYSYGLKVTTSFLAENKIEPQHYIRFAAEVVSEYFKGEKTGHRRATQYINILKSSKKFNHHQPNKLLLKGGDKMKDLFLEVNHILEISNCTKEEALKKVHDTYYSGTTYYYFRKTYFEKLDNSGFL